MSIFSPVLLTLTFFVWQTEDSGATSPPTSSLHGDLFVTIATLLLVVATFLLWMTTRKHVKHTAHLVEIFQNIFQADRKAYVSLSFQTKDGTKPSLCFQNIGRIPVFLESYEIEFSQYIIAGNASPVTTKTQSWVPPMADFVIRNNEIDSLWSKAVVNKIKCNCIYSDIYLKTQRTISMQWLIDHDNKSVTFSEREG